MSRILLVSNRLPITVRTEGREIRVDKSAGGLATGLSGAHEKRGGLWIGWHGAPHGLLAEQRREMDERLEDLRLLPVDLSPEEIQGYYEGFSNGALWPLCHYLLDRVKLDPRDFDCYRRVNERFADRVADCYREGDLIWVHDYQLMLLPALLRERLPGARIGYFLHIPFPSSEVFRILPWRVSILEGLLGADVIGFHTLTYVRHFTTSLLRLLGIESNVDEVFHRGRRVQLGAFPIGVDARKFAGRAAEPAVAARVAELEKENAGRALLLGVDRLDYTKGIPHRLQAIDRLLHRNPGLRDKVRFVQISVPSRTDIDEYAEFRSQVDEMVGRINGAFGTASSVPVHYLYRSVPPDELVALYRAADVMLVTPLRDGMNLVAKEFVATREDEDGVLVLSEFAGAAAELGDAILVNPYDVDQVAGAIQAALEMPEDERRRRMKGLREAVLGYDVHAWASSFVDALDRVEEPASGERIATPADVLARLAARIRESRQTLLLLDYDGTLVPFAKRPEGATPTKELLELLHRLGRQRNLDVHLVSGRPREDLERWFGRLPLGLHAEHGFWSRRGDTRPWIPLKDQSLHWKEQVRPILDQFVARTPRSFVEEKGASLAWHYRQVEPEFGAMQAKELRLHLSETLSNLPLAVLQGKKVLEIRMQGVDKGAVVRSLLSTGDYDTLCALGDDRTDEDTFAALPHSAITIHVGSSPSRATYRLPDPPAALRFLESLTGP